LLCWYWKSPAARITEHHCHWHSELLLLTRGTYEYEVKKSKYAAHTGDCVLYTPRLAHSEENPPEDPPEFYHIKFVWSHIPRKLPLQVHDRDGRLKLFVSWLHDRYWSDMQFSYEYCCGCLAAILGEFMRLSTNPEPNLVKATHAFVLKHISQPITLSQMAENVHLNKYYFVRLYKSLTGISPMQEVRRIRVAHARNLIMTSSMPLKAIAAEVGFSSESALSHAMRKYDHINPMQLRSKKTRKGEK